MTNKLLLSVALFLILSSCKNKSAKADNDFNVSVSDPKLTSIKPKILFDEAHNNHHQIGKTYKPFATLIANDGCEVKSTDKSIDKTALANTDIFIIGTAMGKEDPGDKPPFLQNEVVEIEQWVKDGGSLLLITEHFPFGLAMTPVLSKFGLQVHSGYTEEHY